MEVLDRKYNGWTNYETWNVKLWMDNDEGSYHFWKEATLDALDEGYDGMTRHESVKDAARARLADQLKEHHEEAAPDLGASCYADLLGAALSEVNWCEIAESLIDDNYAEWVNLSGSE